MPGIGVVHVSDFHFGRRVDPWLYSDAPFVKYLNPHSLELAAGLQESISSIPRDRDIEIKVVLSGDVTASGSKEEFCVAHTYVQAGFRFTCPAGSELGLGCDVSQPTLLKVPGNHDQWCGSQYPGKVGHNAFLAGKHFEATPWHEHWNCNGVSIHFFGIDSCCGLSQSAPSRRQEAALDLSLGGEVEQLEDKLRDVQSQAIVEHLNVLIMHHSLASAGFDQPSRARLMGLIEKYGIRIVLTGHTHDSYSQQLKSASHSNISLDCYEVRAASALQGPTKRRWPEVPGFLLHTIKPLKGYGVGGKQFEWNAFRYRWDGPTARFEPYDDSEQSKFFRAFLNPS